MDKGSSAFQLPVVGSGLLGARISRVVAVDPPMPPHIPPELVTRHYATHTNAGTNTNATYTDQEVGDQVLVRGSQSPDLPHLKLQASRGRDACVDP